MRVQLPALAAALTLCIPAEAGSETAGTAVAVALPLVAGGITAYKRDWNGTAELLVTTALTVGTVYGLKHLIRECRPFAQPCAQGVPNWDSMPSDTAALAFAPAEFLRERYGWPYGMPAYVAAGFVGWSRVDARKHHWYDVAASAGISLIYGEIVTSRYQSNRGFYSGLDAGPQGIHAAIGYHF